MDINQQPAQFGDFAQHDRAIEELYSICGRLFEFPNDHEHERNYLLAAVRRTLSLNKAFRQAVESKNGQMAATLVRLNLDTLARTYALYWADETDGMSAETFSKDVFQGKSIRRMKFRGAKDKATDRWLIQQLEDLAEWIPKVYERSSGAIHFSDFHIKQMLGQATYVERLSDGSLSTKISIGPGEKDADPEHYRELKQAYLHITMMFNVAIEGRVKLIFGELTSNNISI